MAYLKRMHLLRRGFLSLFCAALLLFSLRPRLVRYTATFWGVFDSVITLTASVPTREEFDWYLDLADDSFTEYHAFYDRFSESDAIVNLRKVNQEAGQGAIEVEEPLFSLLAYAEKGYRRSMGTVSPSFGPVTELWRRAILSGDRQPPTDQALAQAARYIDPKGLMLDPAGRSVTLDDPAMLLDVGAVAKGYATERVAKALSSAGLSRFALSSGGNIRCGAPPDGRSCWEIGVQSPDEAILSNVASLATLRLCDRAVSTSGDYQRFFWYERDETARRAHHIIDSATLFPGERYRSVTVACDSAADADLFSTALFLLDQEKGEELAERENLAVLWVLPDGKIRKNKAMERISRN